MIKKGHRDVSSKSSRDEKAYPTSNRLNSLIEENAYKTIEVDPTPTQKALQMPLKDWEAIPRSPKNVGAGKED
jgi:hypothetical protein